LWIVGRDKPDCGHATPPKSLRVGGCHKSALPLVQMSKEHAVPRSELGFHPSSKDTPVPSLRHRGLRAEGVRGGRAEDEAVGIGERLAFMRVHKKWWCLEAA